MNPLSLNKKFIMRKCFAVEFDVIGIENNRKMLSGQSPSNRRGALFCCQGLRASGPFVETKENMIFDKHASDFRDTR